MIKYFHIIFLRYIYVWLYVLFKINANYKNVPEVIFLFIFLSSIRNIFLSCCFFLSPYLCKFFLCINNYTFFFTSITSPYSISWFLAITHRPLGRQIMFSEVELFSQILKICTCFIASYFCHIIFDCKVVLEKILFGHTKLFLLQGFRKKIKLDFYHP